MIRGFITVLLTSAFATGCVAAEGDESFVILNNLVPTVDEETMGLLFEPNLNGPFFSSGLISPEASSAFVGSLVESRVQAAEGKESQRTIFIQGANISLQIGEVTAVNGSDVQRFGAIDTREFQQPFAAVLRPNGGVAVGIYDLIPPDIMAEIRGKMAPALGDPAAEVFLTVTSTTTMFGDFYGDRIDSTSFVFPVVVTRPAVSL